MSVYAQHRTEQCNENLANQVAPGAGTMADRRTLKRLFDNMRSDDIAKALGEAEWPVSGSKEERIDRVLDAIFADSIKFAQVLEYAYKEDMSRMCEDLELHKRGTRDVLMGRLSEWFGDEFGHRVTASDDEDEDDSDDKPAKTSLKLQGRPDHQAMQNAIVNLGQLRGFHVRTNHGIGAGFMPDVLWYRLNPSDHTNAAAIAAFEIEFGSAQAIAKSLSSLKHAFDLGAHKLFLILPSSRVEGAKLRLGGAFHEIAGSINVLPIEDMIRLDMHKLAKRLGYLNT